MKLRARLESSQTTLNDLVISAAQRLNEATNLKASGQNHAAVYLAGYSAEMLLKYAFMRFQGALPGDFVEPMLKPARNLAKTLILGTEDEGFHSVLFWMELLKARRLQAANGLPDPVDRALVWRIQCIYDRWWVSMRYRSNQATADEADEMLRQVSWLTRFHTLLWR